MPLARLTSELHARCVFRSAAEAAPRASPSSRRGASASRPLGFSDVRGVEVLVAGMGACTLCVHLLLSVFVVGYPRLALIVVEILRMVQDEDKFEVLYEGQASQYRYSCATRVIGQMRPPPVL